MPWKENDNNNEPWGNPEDKQSNKEKKKGKVEKWVMSKKLLWHIAI